jgi:hypothetical protein
MAKVKGKTELIATRNEFYNQYLGALRIAAASQKGLELINKSLVERGRNPSADEC